MGREGGEPPTFITKFTPMIVFTVKICKQCLQTASASGGPSPRRAGLYPGVANEQTMKASAIHVFHNVANLDVLV